MLLTCFLFIMVHADENKKKFVDKLNAVKSQIDGLENTLKKMDEDIKDKIIEPVKGKLKEVDKYGGVINTGLKVIYKIKEPLRSIGLGLGGVGDLPRALNILMRLLKNIRDVLKDNIKNPFQYVANDLDPKEDNKDIYKKLDSSKKGIDNLIKDLG